MFLTIIILLLAIPIGYLIAYLTKEELKQGKKYFKIIIALAFISGIYFYIVEIPYAVSTSAFIAIVTFISIIKA